MLNVKVRRAQPRGYQWPRWSSRVALSPPFTGADSQVPTQMSGRAVSKGQIIYSDVPCDKLGAKSMGTVDATPNEVDGIRRAPVTPPPSPLYSPAANSNSSGVTTQARSADVKARERRQHELGLIINGLTTTPEQKQAAHEELASIGAFGTCNLSESDRKRRDGLV